MEIEPHDQDITKLLTKLKDVHGEYPEKLLVARRQSYLKRISEIELGMHGGKGAEQVAKSPKPSSGFPATSTILEAALIIAIVAEASVMTYFYREKVVDFFRSITTSSKGQEITPAPVVPTSEEVQGTSPAPAIASTIAASPTDIEETPTSTPIPEVVDENSSTTPGVDSTPDPNGNNGHHYGQTPKPERTKENNGNNDKPPKDKPTKKPTKAK